MLLGATLPTLPAPMMPTFDVNLAPALKGPAPASARLHFAMGRPGVPPQASIVVAANAAGCTRRATDRVRCSSTARLVAIAAVSRCVLSARADIVGAGVATTGILGPGGVTPAEPSTRMPRRFHHPEHIDEFRDQRWRREATRQVHNPHDAEHFIEQVGFAACMTDARRPGPSLYIAVCGRRDAVMPRNVQTDPEASLTWRLKDELVRRGRVYYAKLPRGKTLFLAPRMIPYFHALWGVRRSEESRRLSRHARAILRALRREWEMGTSDLRAASGVTDRSAFTRALDELQATMLVIPSEVVYRPAFTYIWTLAVGRFPDALRRRVPPETGLREIARCFLSGAGMTLPGELARVTGLSRPDAGRGNRALVAEGYATMLAPGVYQLASLPIGMHDAQERTAVVEPRRRWSRSAHRGRRPIST